LVDFFDTHDTSRVWQQMKPAAPVKLPARQAAAIRARHEARKAAISIRLEPLQIKAARKIAARKSIGYQTQLRMWIAEGIRRESRT
jgi:predicted DNA binding CopG/RHH family protein